MKKILLRSHTLLLLFTLGCSEFPWQTENIQPTLKSEQQPKTVYPCNFSTETMTTKLNSVFWHYTSWNMDDNHPSQFIELESQTATNGYSSWRSNKTVMSWSMNERQENICKHLENEFIGFNNAAFRSHHFIEKYKVARLRNATSNLANDEFAEVKPESSYLVIEYADPTISPQEPIKIKAIPITSTCRESTKVNNSEGRKSLARFKFRHSETCDFVAIDHEYKLHNGEKIRLSLTGSLEPSYISERLLLKIKQVSFRNID